MRSSREGRGGDATASSLPIVDVSALVGQTTACATGNSTPEADDVHVAERRSAAARARAAAEIGAACRDVGFFYVVDHGVDAAIQERLVDASRRFFALGEDAKREIAMARGGRAWRGWFPLGGELTSGRPDEKEGIYFGAELAPDHPLVAAGAPLHGANLFPRQVPELRDAVLAYMDEMSRLGAALLRGLALSLGLAEDDFAARYTQDPLTLFRIFRYPPPEPAPNAAGGADAALGPEATGAGAVSGAGAGDTTWGVAEHTDYGFLTILKQDDAGGLEVRTPAGWVDAPPIPNAFVCNIGDMLERLTRGLYRSTPHRLRNRSGRDRLSFPFFYDPGWNADIAALAIAGSATVPAQAIADADDDRPRRWDGASVHDVRGTYGDYLMSKVAKVFPDLGSAVLPVR